MDSTHFKYSREINLSKISFRGLSVVDDRIIWASGSKGTIAKSVDGGNSFTFMQLKGFEKSDFRDIEAFDNKTAIVMSSGTPAFILKTIDGGISWQETYKNTDTSYFLDAMDFWDIDNGIIIGDPIDNHFVLLTTQNGGLKWDQIDTSNTPVSLNGEALFAASGTSLKCHTQLGELMFVTGGNYSRLFGGSISQKNIKWKSFPIPIVQGNSSQGAFSFAYNDSALIVVGGDYLNDTAHSKNSCAQYIEPKRLHKGFDKLIDDVKGYRSCIERVNTGEFVACGTSGVDYYRNKHWKTISNVSFNVVKKAKKGSAVFLAGNKGKIGKLVR